MIEQTKKTMISQVMLVIGIFTFFSIGVPAPVQSHKKLNGPCDGFLKPSDDQMLAYKHRKRDDRCEGIYDSRIGLASTTFELLSFLQGRPRYDLESHRILEVSAPNISGVTSEPIYVRAVALDPLVYYRMDAIMPAERPFQWPIGPVLRPMFLSEKRIGVFGWVEAEENLVIVPLRVYGRTDPEEREELITGRLELIVRVTEPIKEVQWRLISADGEAASDWKSIGRGLYTGDIIRIHLNNEAPGSEAVVTIIEIIALNPDDNSPPELIVKDRLQLYAIQPGRSDG